MDRPYIIINCAASADGKIALPDRRRLRISSPKDVERVQRLRESCDAILVGIETILSDNPKLTVKRSNVRQPLRVVLDSKGRTPDNAEVLNESASTIIFVGKGVKRKVERSNVEIVACKLDKRGFVDLHQVVKELVKRGVKSLLVEGGGTVIWNFISQQLFDEFYVYIAPIVIGGRNTPTIVDGEGIDGEKSIIRLKMKDARILDGGLLVKYVP